MSVRKGPFPVERIWLGKSYQDRFAIFCERLMDEGLYDSVCYITSSKEDTKPIELVTSLDWRHFSAAINARIKYLEGLGLPGLIKARCRCNSLAAPLVLAPRSASVGLPGTITPIW